MRLVGSSATCVVGVLLSAILLGCSVETIPSEGALSVTCIEQPFRAELHVDARDPRRVWATNYESGLDVAVRPRPPEQFGFDSARPTILLNGHGDVLSFSGEITKTGCFDAAIGTLYVGPADVPDPNRPPN
jgi:hypothetical protein